MSSLVDQVTTPSKAVRVMMPFMATVVMTQFLPVQETIPFGVVQVMTPFPVQLEPILLTLDPVTIPLMSLLSTAQSLPAQVMTPSMF